MFNCILSIESEVRLTWFVEEKMRAITCQSIGLLLIKQTIK